MEPARQRKRRGDLAAQRPEVHHHHRAQDRQRVGKARRPEEHPRDHHKPERQQPLQRRMQRVILLAEKPVEHARQPVQQSPEQEQPARAVPQAARQEHDHQVDAGAHCAFAAAAQREIDVVRQEARERHVPALPELADVQALVRRIEVERQLDVEHQRHARGHVAVAGEVEVQLEGVAQRHKPRLRGVERLRGAKARLHGHAERVRDDDLLEQAQRERVEARGEVVEVEAAVLRVRELRHDLAVEHDGARDQLREERDEERVVEDVVARHRALVAVNHIGELLEGEERDAQRQRHVVEREREAKRAVHVRDEEVVILEVEQHAEVEGEAQQHQRQADALARRREHALAERVVDQDAAHDDRHIARVVVAVEHERRQHQKELVERDALRQPAQQVIAEQRQRQKGQNEDVGIEQHVGWSPLRVSCVTRLHQARKCRPARRRRLQCTRRSGR